ncbi:hypothetical protein E2L08_08410 [Palleronia sediminis]|uniref:Uncharacterized protein n=1 Tax=Palleronia sediminis TaxID=2547833 RepID=A0A4R6A795_9RHOB|nr:hypothetical protein [Palleronia sediminis]TDL79621.1 hypothetical protein E2L08_08410 [Palleronia sediminis]
MSRGRLRAWLSLEQACTDEVGNDGLQSRETVLPLSARAPCAKLAREGLNHPPPVRLVLLVGAGGDAPVQDPGVQVGIPFPIFWRNLEVDLHRPLERFEMSILVSALAEQPFEMCRVLPLRPTLQNLAEAKDIEHGWSVAGQFHVL